MTIPDIERQVARRTRRDLTALAMIVAGSGGLFAVAAMWDWRAVLALVSVAVIVAGVLLGMDR